MGDYDVSGAWGSTAPNLPKEAKAEPWQTGRAPEDYIVGALYLDKTTGTSYTALELDKGLSAIYRAVDVDGRSLTVGFMSPAAELIWKPEPKIEKDPHFDLTVNLIVETILKAGVESELAEKLANDAGLDLAKYSPEEQKKLSLIAAREIESFYDEYLKRLGRSIDYSFIDSLDSDFEEEEPERIAPEDKNLSDISDPEKILKVKVLMLNPPANFEDLEAFCQSSNVTHLELLGSDDDGNFEASVGVADPKGNELITRVYQTGDFIIAEEYADRTEVKIGEFSTSFGEYIANIQEQEIEIVSVSPRNLEFYRDEKLKNWLSQESERGE